MAVNLLQTMIDLVGLPSTPGEEQHVRGYLVRRLHDLGLAIDIDAVGNLICALEGDGEPLLLSAHMDRVPPGLGLKPILRDGMLYGDGSTDLGADDAAGLAIILDVISQVVRLQLPHPPVVAVFTVQAETGHQGAQQFNAAQYGLTQGLVFDDGFEAGTVISEGAAYVGFDVTILGQAGHPGRSNELAVDAIEIFRRTDYPTGSFESDQTRIQLGQISAGSARNSVAAEVYVEGELRSFESSAAQDRYKSMILDSFTQTAMQFGGNAVVVFTDQSAGYKVGRDEPLLNVYEDVLKRRGSALILRPSFAGGDNEGFRPRMKTFTISTGVMNEHSPEEFIPIAPLEQLATDTLEMLRLLAPDS